MPELAIPPLEPQLAEIFEDVVFSKQYKELPQVKWSSDILPKLINRLEEIASLANKHGEKYSKRPRGVDLPQSINRRKDAIVRHLNDVFLNKPPFTIQRIAEITLNPEKEGYSLTNNAKVLKYFNSFSKLVVVASSVFDYPEVTFVNPTMGGSKATNPPTNQTVQTIPLVPIPWLKTESPGREKQPEGNSLVLDPMLISPPPAGQLENSKLHRTPENGSTNEKNVQTPSVSPSRRRREPDTREVQSESKQEYAAKRARTDEKPSPCKQGPSEVDNDEDRMDISNSTLEDITPSSSNVTPTKSQNNNSDPISDEHNDTTGSETILNNKDRDLDNENKMDISSENIIVSDEEPLVY
ncbi:uncharacterized protein AC631_05167 [Debaryomyces fabryi]|uniref:Uncharacterized protein n=1 Tax=Debaryomyces fabryi TaxID=58627 RepID=A0A0V1PSE1_9ASCO|nr:uncharacterized protein AC631_05167 [Debaryomyces fabryi]KRZ99065.1 hypothetical protein AC631_05167 [Debaryomyces fabryi]CUM47583.1 unnamed protein product [Debaryomyces fabryi]